MPDSDEELLPGWPLRLALLLLLVGEALFVLMRSTLVAIEPIAMTLSAACLIVLCVVTWRGISWGRWLLIAFLLWRVADITWRVADRVISAAPPLFPCQSRVGGTPALVPIYVLVAFLLASPLGRARVRAVT